MEQIITAFYTAFQNKDAEQMVSFYHDDIEFTDPAFGTLQGEHAKNMWRMLLANSKDLSLEFSQISTSGNTGKAHWEARYTFSQTGRKVLNKIDAEFTFKEGKIINHVDSFNLKTWAKQALGFKGAVLGGTAFFKRKLNQQTQALLARFEQNNKK